MISGVIITYNEEEKIANAILSLQPVCNEVIIIDAESTDNTRVIAEEHGAHVVTKKWQGYGRAMNFGASIAIHNWICSIDADEQIIPTLNLNTRNLDSSLGYKFRFETYVGGQHVRFGPYFNQWRGRLYHRKNMKWSTEGVHESLIRLDGTKGRFKKLDISIIHNTASSIIELESKLDHYASLKRRAPKSQLSRKIIYGYHLIRYYIFKFGIFGGHLGWQLSNSYAKYHSIK